MPIFTFKPITEDQSEPIAPAGKGALTFRPVDPQAENIGMTAEEVREEPESGLTPMQSAIISGATAAMDAKARTRAAIGKPVKDDGSLLKDAGRGVTHGAIGLLESVGTGTQWLGNRLRSETIAGAGETASDYWGKKAEPWGPSEEIAGKNVIDNPELLGNASWWVYNVADMIPALAATMIPGTQAGKVEKAIQIGGTALKLTPKLVARLAKLGKYLPAGLVGGGLEGTQTYKAVLQNGGSEEEAARAGELMTVGAGVLNAIGTGKILEKAGSGFKGRVVKMLGSGAWEGLTEGAEEPTEVLSKYVGKYLAGEELPDNLTEQLVESLKDAATVAPIAGVTGAGGSLLAGGGSKEQLSTDPAKPKNKNLSDPSNFEPVNEEKPEVPERNFRPDKDPMENVGVSPQTSKDRIKVQDGLGKGGIIDPAAEPDVETEKKADTKELTDQEKKEVAERAFPDGFKKSDEIYPVQYYDPGEGETETPAPKPEPKPEKKPPKMNKGAYWVAKKGPKDKPFQLKMGDEVVENFPTFKEASEAAKKGNADVLVTDSVDNDQATDIKSGQTQKEKDDAQELKDIESAAKNAKRAGQKSAPTVEQLSEQRTEKAESEAGNAIPDGTPQEQSQQVLKRPITQEDLEGLTPDQIAEIEKKVKRQAGSEKAEKKQQKKRPHELTKEEFDANATYHHGTDEKSLAMIDKEGFKGDVPSEHRKYSYGQFGPGNIYLSNAGKGKQWLDKEWTKKSRAVSYDKSLPVLFTEKANIKTINSAEEADKLAQELGFKNFADAEQATWFDAYDTSPDDPGYKEHYEPAMKAKQKFLDAGIDALDIRADIGTSEPQVVVLNPSVLQTHKQAVQAAIKSGGIKAHPDYPELTETTTTESQEVAGEKGEEPEAESQELDGESVWRGALTEAGRKQAAKTAGMDEKEATRVSKTLWRHLDPKIQNQLAPHLKDVSEKGQAETPVETEPAPESPPVETKPIGKNSKGEELYQDPKGVRYRIEDGVKIFEPVSMVPTKEGLKVDTDRRNRPEWKTVEETEKEWDEKAQKAIDESKKPKKEVLNTQYDQAPKAEREKLVDKWLNLERWEDVYNKLKETGAISKRTERFIEKARTRSADDMTDYDADFYLEAEADFNKWIKAAPKDKPSTTKKPKGPSTAGMSSERAYQEEYKHWLRNGRQGNPPDAPAHLLNNPDVFWNFLKQIENQVEQEAAEDKPKTKEEMKAAIDDFFKSDKLPAMKRALESGKMPNGRALSETDKKILREEIDKIENPEESSVDNDVDELLAFADQAADEAEAREKKEAAQAKIQAGLDKIKAGAAAFNDIFGEKGTIGDQGEIDPEKWIKAKAALDLMWEGFKESSEGVKEAAKAFITEATNALSSKGRAYVKKYIREDIKEALEKEKNNNYNIDKEEPQKGGDQDAENRDIQSSDVQVVDGESGVDAGIRAGNDQTPVSDRPETATPKPERESESGNEVELTTEENRYDADGSTGRDSDEPGSTDGSGTEAAPAGEPGSSNTGLGGESGNAELTPADKNHVIQKDDVIVPKGPETKIQANIDAIRQLKILQSENRNPSPEEKQILAKYVGWGAFSQKVFNYQYNRYLNKHADLKKPEEYFSAEELPKYKTWAKKYGKKLHPGLGGLMTKEEWESASASTINAHYTSRGVIQGMWGIAERMGFTGGKVLEPAAGIGHFFGLMPQSIAKKSALFGVEKDTLSGAILEKLYPQANIQTAPFEKTRSIDDNSMDLVITNVPFANISISDKKHPQYSGWSLHNYFIARSLSATKPGGLVMAITSSWTMDAKKNGKIREYLADQADMVGAIRLPNNAFAENAGTEVVTDILVFRKKDSAGVSVGHDFRVTNPLETPKTKEIEAEYKAARDAFETFKSKHKGASKNPRLKSQYEALKAAVDEKFKEVSGIYGVNEYFMENPDMVLGKHAMTGTMYASESYTVEPIKGQDIQDLLSKVTQSFPKDIAGEGSDISMVKPVQYADLDSKEGTLTTKDGKIYLIDNGRLVTPFYLNSKGKKTEITSGKRLEQVKKYVELRDFTASMFEMMNRTETTDAEVSEAIRKLNKIYDKYVKKFGNLGSTQNSFLRKMDNDFAVADSLEIEEEVSGKPVFVKAALFEKRTIFPFVEPTTAENIDDAINLSLVYRGAVNPSYIASLLGKNVEKVKKEILDSGSAFLNPENGLFESRDAYLSGHVKKKLRIAKAMAENSPLYKNNIKALETVVPEDLDIEFIEFKLSAPWMPPEAIQGFLKEVLDVDATVEYAHNDVSSRWNITGVQNATNVKNTQTFGAIFEGAGGVYGHELVEHALNMRRAKIMVESLTPAGNRTTTEDKDLSREANIKISEINNEFVTWAKTHATWATEIAKKYNEEKNGHVLRKHTAPGIDYFPNASHAIKLREHQKIAVSRALQESVLLAYGVGTGKTFIYVTTAMEMRRIGTAKKPLIVVHNQTIDQYRKAFKVLYPGAKVLIPNFHQRSSKMRKKTLVSMATGDWDAIVLPQSFFNGIANDPNRERAFVEEQIEMIEAAIIEAKEANESPFTVKDLEKLKERKRQKLDALLDRQKDEAVRFEQMGIDALLIDEVHAYKRSEFFTKMSQIKGIDNGASQRSTSLILKSEFVRSKTGGKNVVTATGTPISNTMAELWTMLRYVRPDLLEEYGVTLFDDFAGTFGEVVEGLEETASGFKEVERFAKYVNGPELLTMFFSGADVRLTKDAQLNLPEIAGGKPESVISEKSPELKSFLKDIIDRWRAWENLPGKEKRFQRHVPLVLYGLAKKATVDLRMVDPKFFKDHPENKLSKSSEKIHEIWERTKADRSTQIVFLDIFQDRSKNPRFNAHHELSRKLVEKGIPEKEILLFGEANEKQQARMKDQIRSGEARIIIGTRAKLGVGVDIATKMIAAHHLNVPDRPMDIEQSDGRIVRQGNENKQVEIFHYCTKDSLDSVMFGRLLKKQRFSDQVLTGDIDGRTFNDPYSEEQASFAEFAAASSGKAGKLLFEKNELLSNENKFKIAQTAFIRKISNARAKLREIPDMITSIKDRMVTENKTKAHFDKAFPDGKIDKITYNGEELERTDFIDSVTKEVESAADQFKKDLPGVQLGDYLNLPADKLHKTIKAEAGGVQVVITVSPNTNFNRWDATEKPSKKIKLDKDTPLRDLHVEFRYNNNGIGYFFAEYMNLKQNFTRNFNSIIASEIEAPARSQARIDRAEQEIKEYEKIVSEDFKYKQDLIDTQRRLKQIDQELIALSREEEAEESGAEAKRPEPDNSAKYIFNWEQYFKDQGIEWGKFPSSGPQADIQFSSKPKGRKRANLSQLSANDIRKAIPGKLPSGIDKDGNIWVRVAPKKIITIKSIEQINADTLRLQWGFRGKTSETEDYFGAYYDKEVLISAIGDRWAVKHEWVHALEDMGLIGPDLQRVIEGKVKATKGFRKVKWYSDKDSGEARAEWITDALKRREEFRGTRIGRVLQKIQDFIDGIVNLFHQTATGIVRDIESGKIYDKPVKENQSQRYTPAFQAVKQAISSAGTSLKQVAAVFKKISFEPGTVNVDIGGGKYDEGTTYLAGKGVRNLVYDPFNRTKEYNDAVVREVAKDGADTATANNVLNVIREPEVRLEVIRQAAKAVKPEGTAYFSIHEGHNKADGTAKQGDGIGRETPRGWQNYLKTSEYIPEVKKYFKDVKKTGNIIVAKNPIKDSSMSIWEDEQGEPVFSKRAKELTDKVLTEEIDYQHIKNTDMSRLERAIRPPHWLAKRFPVFKKLYDRQHKRDQERMKRLSDSLNETGTFWNLDTDQTKELSEIVFTLEGRKIKGLPSWIAPTAGKEKIRKWAENHEEIMPEAFNDEELAELYIEHNPDAEIGVNPEYLPALEKWLQGKGVSPEVAEAYAQIRQSLDKDLLTVWDKMKNMEDVDPETIAEYRRSLVKVQNYFPHKRYGNHFIQVIDPTNIDEETGKGKVLYREHFYAPKMADAMVSKRKMEQLLKAHPNFKKYKVQTGQVSSLSEEVYEYPIPVEAMEQVINAAVKRISDPETQKAFNQLLPQATADVLKSRGWASHAIQRKGIPGHETENLQKVLFDYKSGLYGWLTKMDASKDFSETMTEVDAATHKNLFGAMKTYAHDMLANSDEVDRAVAAAKSVFFAKYLGANIKTAVLNLTQNLIAGAPRLGMEVGGGYMKWFNGAGKQLVSYYKGQKNLSEGQIRLLNEFFEEGTTQANYIEEVMGQFAGGPKSSWNKFVKFLGLPMTIAEKFNRASLALAAFDAATAGKITNKKTLKTLGLKPGEKASYEQAKEFAQTIVDDAHFVYGKANRPEIFRGSNAGKIANAAYTFRTFTHNLINLWKEMWRSGGPGKRAVMKSLAATVSIGGISSIPLYKTFMHLIRQLTGDDWEEEMILSNIPEDADWLRDIVAYGFPAILGVNLGGSVGMELPVFERIRVDNSFVGQVWAGTGEILGIPGAILEDAESAIRAMNSGQGIRAFEYLLPVGFANLLKGARMSKQGIYSSSGRPVVLPGETEPQKIDTGEMIGKMFGFQPISVTKGWNLSQKINDFRTYKVSAQSQFADQLANAIHKNDRKKVNEVAQKIRQWNVKQLESGHPEYLINIRQALRSRLEGRQPPKYLKKVAFDLKNSMMN